MAQQLPGKKGSIAYWKRSVVDRKLNNERLGPLSERLKGASYAVNSGVSAYNVMKPLLVGALILLFVVGPATIGLSRLLGAISWYWWLAFTVITLLFLRR